MRKVLVEEQSDILRKRGLGNHNSPKADDSRDDLGVCANSSNLNRFTFLCVYFRSIRTFFFRTLTILFELVTVLEQCETNLLVPSLASVLLLAALLFPVADEVVVLSLLAPPSALPLLPFSPFFSCNRFLSAPSAGQSRLHTGQAFGIRKLL